MVFFSLLRMRPPLADLPPSHHPVPQLAPPFNETEDMTQESPTILLVVSQIGEQISLPNCKTDMDANRKSEHCCHAE